MAGSDGLRGDSNTRPGAAMTAPTCARLGEGVRMRLTNVTIRAGWLRRGRWTFAVRTWRFRVSGETVREIYCGLFWVEVAHHSTDPVGVNEFSEWSRSELLRLWRDTLGWRRVFVRDWWRQWVSSRLCPRTGTPCRRRWCVVVGRLACRGRR
jgi:hypothetical protein